jgi:hypothetical protein
MPLFFKSDAKVRRFSHISKQIAKKMFSIRIFVILLPSF